MSAWDLTVSIIQNTLMYASPLIIAAMGGLICERSGVVNIALEGIMLVGAFASGTAYYYIAEAGSSGNTTGYISLIFAAVFGALFSFLLSLAAIKFKADQTIAGTALNMLSIGITASFCFMFFGSRRTPSIAGIGSIPSIPILGDIPVIGKMFFQRAYLTTFLAFIIVLLTFYFIFKTRFGLRLRACGENPHAAQSVGINVSKMRFIAVTISGALAGLAGGVLLFISDNQFSTGVIHGFGFIAIAAVIFGKWKPLTVMLAALFFGLSQTLSSYASAIPVLNTIPSGFYSAIPYVFTIIALIIFSGKSVGPKAAGEIFDSGKR